MDDEQFRKILLHFGLSWEGYHKVRKGVKKRIRQHMQYSGCHTINTYLMKLDQDKSLKIECENLLTVSISRFFRDRQMWATLETSILPELLKNTVGKVKVWSAGCACGEEVYSFKIVWDRFKKEYAIPSILEVTATDMNPTYLEKAAIGTYTPSSLKEVMGTDFSLYFEKVKKQNRYRIKDRLRNDILWKPLDLRQDIFEEEYQMIFIRNNIMTYYLDPLKTDIFKKVLNHLDPSGFLIIGSNESLPSKNDNLEPVAPFSYVFRKVS